MLWGIPPIWRGQRHFVGQSPQPFFNIASANSKVAITFAPKVGSFTLTSLWFHLAKLLPNGQSRLTFVWGCCCPIWVLLSLLSMGRLDASTHHTLHFDSMALRMATNCRWSWKRSQQCLYAKGFATFRKRTAKHQQWCHHLFTHSCPSLDMLIATHKPGDAHPQITPFGFWNS